MRDPELTDIRKWAVKSAISIAAKAAIATVADIEAMAGRLERYVITGAFEVSTEARG